MGRDATLMAEALIDAGYAHRLLPSHDWSLIWVAAETPLTSPAEREARNPHGYLYLKKVVLPQLRELGVAEAIPNRLCVDGPRNFFEGV